VSELRVNGIVEESVTDGPGLRFVVFSQGCPHRCPGCHNPETHDASGGYTADTEALFTQFARNPLLSGVTFSGGEPFRQPEALADLAGRVHALGKTVIIYTGYTVERLHELADADQAVRALLEEADILVDGPYVESLRTLDSGFKGSSNQRILDRGAVREIRRKLPAQTVTA
jgi:anaerobic ribonucleoside-triphosphate reductase activating protein